MLLLLLSEKRISSGHFECMVHRVAAAIGRHWQKSDQWPYRPRTAMKSRSCGTNLLQEGQNGKERPKIPERLVPLWPSIALVP